MDEKKKLIGRLKEDVRMATERFRHVVGVNTEIRTMLENDRAHAVRELKRVNEKIAKATYKARKDQQDAVFELQRAEMKHEKALKEQGED